MSDPELSVHPELPDPAVGRSSFRDHALRDGFALCWREAAIKRLALVCQIEEKLRRLEPLPVSCGEIVEHLDEILHAHAVYVGDSSAGERRKSETENRTDIGFAHVGDHLVLD